MAEQIRKFRDRSRSLQYNQVFVCHSCGVRQIQNPIKKPWRRILYERQDYPDNFVDDTFLSCLITNANVHNPTFSSVVYDSLAITQQLSITIIFLVVFWTVWRGSIRPQLLLAVDVIFIVFGNAMKLALDCNFNRNLVQTDRLTGNCFDLVKFLGILLGLSPILMTLTSAYSDDTIWALTIVLCSMHVCLHDYSWSSNSDFAGTISLNAAVFASVLLASRLRVGTEVFVFLLFAFSIFAGFPFLSRSMRRISPQLHIGATLLAQSIAVISLYFVSIAACVAMICSLLFISFVCPFWLKWIKRYKNEIQGPWDYDAENETPGQ